MAYEEERKEESEAITKCLEGDQDAFRLLIEKYQKRGVSIALGYVRNIDDAQDLVQDAFIKAYRSLHRFEIGSSFYTWFYRIVVNVCIDHYRKNKKRRSVEYDETYTRKDALNQHPVVPNASDLQPHVRSERVELNAALQAALDTLSENHRTVIVLREVEGLSYEEIAESMDCHIGTVMSRLHHARKKLQESLRPYLIESGQDHLAERAGEGVGTKRK